MECQPRVLIAAQLTRGVFFQHLNHWKINFFCWGDTSTSVPSAKCWFVGSVLNTSTENPYQQRSGGMGDCSLGVSLVTFLAAFGNADPLPYEGKAAHKVL